MVKLVKSGFFLGEYRHNLTERNRLALPKRIRAEIEGKDVILTQGYEKCIIGYTIEMWKEMAKQPLSIPIYEEKGRILRRQLFSAAIITELDSQGRIVLPETLLSWAELKGKIGEEVVIIGSGDHFEMWEKGVWETYSNQKF